MSDTGVYIMFLNRQIDDLQAENAGLKLHISKLERWAGFLEKPGCENWHAGYGGVGGCVHSEDETVTICAPVNCARLMEGEQT